MLDVPDQLNQDQFWNLITEILCTLQNEYVTGMPEEVVNSLLVQCITLAIHCENKKARFYEKSSKFLIDCDWFIDNMEFCTRKLLSLLQYTNDNNTRIIQLSQKNDDLTYKDSLVQNIKLIEHIGWILYYLHDQEALSKFQWFDILSSTLLNFYIIKSRISLDYELEFSNYLLISIDYCSSLDVEQLHSLPDRLLGNLFSSLMLVSRNEDYKNFLQFKLILALNEQFMIQSHELIYDNDAQSSRCENKVFLFMIQDDNFSNFVECLMLHFNREDDHILQILILKVFYLIFTTSMTCKWIYLNDLKVLVDIFIRELLNLSITNEAPLINTYLRVLYPMLCFTQLSDVCYKLSNIKDALQNLISNESCSKTMKRLTERCLDLKLFSEESDDQESIVSNSTTSSFRQPPPIPLARKFQKSIYITDNNSSFDLASSKVSRTPQ
ncbi:hypothetical protein LJB42_000156 [Komagataella kurtzmanii]|nr:hypothetical protein LJB42_000156 [Komagataella kurtzmanii]